MLLNEITMYNNNYYEVPYLAHHGILGMKWGCTSLYYDGFVDAEDWVGGFAEYPVVLIDPKISLKFKSENKRW